MSAALKAPDFGKMVGPLPLGGWVAATGGGLWLAYRARKSSEAASAAASAASAATGGAYATGGPVAAAGASTPVYGSTVTLAGSGAGSTATATAPAAILTNDDWLYWAVSDLVGRGYSGFTAQQALEAYLEGAQLTADQQKLVETAIRLTGPAPTSPVLQPAPIPPAGNTPVTVAPPPPPPPAPAPAPAPVVNTYVTNLPNDLALRIAAGGETVVKGLPWAAGPAGSGWWLGSYGGVFAIGGAPFRGSAVNYGFGPPGGRRATDIEPSGSSGYRITSNYGENYDFPGN